MTTGIDLGPFEFGDCCGTTVLTDQVMSVGAIDSDTSEVWLTTRRVLMCLNCGNSHPLSQTIDRRLISQPAPCGDQSYNELAADDPW